MSDLLSGASRLTAELKRRRVFRVAIIYAAAGWVTVEVAATVLPILLIPDWAVRLVVVAVILGFPVALALAWAFDVTATGIQRTDPMDVTAGAPPNPSSGGAALRPPAPLRWPALRPWRALTVLLVLFAALAGGAWWSLARRNEAPELSATTVAVLPFEYRGAAAFSYLGDGMVDLLGRKLNGAGDLRTVHPQALLSRVDPARSRERLSPESARRLAGQLGAGLFVMGTATEAGGRLQLYATLFDANGTEITTGEASGPESDLFALIDDLARKLLGRRLPGPAGRLTELASETTTSLPALKAYLEGERLLRSGALEGAIEAYGRAVAEDSSFALAHYRHGVALSWVGQLGPAWSSQRTALRHASRLSADDRLLLEAVVAYTRSDAAAAERLYRQVLDRHPDHVEAWYQLGEVLFHFNSARGRSPVDAIPAFDHAIALDSGHVFSMLHLLHARMMQRDLPQVDTLVERLSALDTTGDFALTWGPFLRAAVTDDPALQDRVLESYRHDGRALRRVAFDVAIIARDLEFGRQVARAAIAAEPDPVLNGSVYRTLGEIEVARGSWSAAVEALREFERISGMRGAVAGYAAWPFVPASAEQLQNAAAGLRLQLEALRTSGAENLAAEIDLRFGLAAIEFRLGDTTAVRSAVPELERLIARHTASAATNQAGMLSPVHAAALLRAILAFEQSAAADAVAILEAPDWEVKGLEVRYLYARALEAVGRDQDALRWYDTFDNEYLVGTWHLPPLAPSHLHRAEIYDRRGDMERAAFHYGRFVTLWQHADPDLQPLVAGARRRLAELGEPREPRP